MKIIQPGNAAEKEYRCTCRRCGCDFMFVKSEPGVEVKFDQRDGDFMFVKCPQSGCPETNTMAL